MTLQHRHQYCGMMYPPALPIPNALTARPQHSTSYYVRFVKNMGKDTALCPNGMDVAKLTHKKVLQTLENGIRFGKWVLLENIGEVSLRYRVPAFVARYIARDKLRRHEFKYLLFCLS